MATEGGHPFLVYIVTSQSRFFQMSSKIVAINGQKADLSLSTSHKKTALVLAHSVKLACEKFGLSNLGFLTLTFAQHVTCPKEAQRRLNSLFTNVIKPRYGDYVGVFERQKHGRIHYHLLVHVGHDIRTGFDFDAVEACDYRSANKKLRSEWAFWRKTAKLYGFGRTELMPIKSTSEAIGKYVGKYIGKHIEGRAFSHAIGEIDTPDKGVRLVRYSNGVRAGNTRFMFVSEGSLTWRKKVALFAQIVEDSTGQKCRSIEDISRIVGKKWAYHNRDFIMSLPVD